MRRKDDFEEHASGGVVPNVSYNYDSRMYEAQASGQEDSYAGYGQSGEYSSRADSQFGSRNGQPVDEDGNPVRNYFVPKMVFAILELLFSRVFGILAIIFTALQNSAWQKGDLAGFRKKSKAATVFLVIGYLIGLLVIGLIAALYTRYSQYQDFYDAFRQAIEEDFSEEEWDFDTDDSDVEVYPEEYRSAEGTIDVDGVYEIVCSDALVTVDGSMTLGELADTCDWEWDMEPEELAEEGVLGAGDSALLWFGNYAMNYLEIVNASGEDADLLDCGIDMISIDLLDGPDTDFLYMDSLTEDSLPEDFAEVFGEDYEYSTDEDGWKYETWYTVDGQVTAVFDGADGDRLIELTIAGW